MSRSNFKILLAIISFLVCSCVQDDINSNDSKTKQEFLAKYDQNAGDTITEEDGYTRITKRIKMKDIETIKVDLSMDCGKFEVCSDENDLMNGIFKFRENRQKPVINYMENEKNEGALAICMKWTKDNEKNYDSDCKAYSKIALSNKTPTDMHIEFGAGEGTFNLQGMQIKTIDIESGAGEFNVNLCNTSVQKINMAAGVGEANINLTGKRTNDLQANFACGIGEITVLLPSDVNIEIHTSGVLGSINAKGFERDKRHLYYKPEKESNINVNLDIAGGIGEINLILDN